MRLQISAMIEVRY